MNPNVQKKQQEIQGMITTAQSNAEAIRRFLADPTQPIPQGIGNSTSANWLKQGINVNSARKNLQQELDMNLKEVQTLSNQMPDRAPNAEEQAHMQKYGTPQDATNQSQSQLPNINLQPGSTDKAAVKQLQQYLVSQGYMTQEQMDTGPGIYGPQTKSAVGKLQKTLNLPVPQGQEGFFGPLTRGAVQNNVAENNNASTGSGTDIGSSAGSSAPQSYSTGDPTQDALLQELQNFIKAQQDAGLKINEALNFDQATIDKFLETAKKQINPYFQNQIDTIKQDVLRAAPQILQNYESDVADRESKFQSSLDNSRENMADRGLAFSGQRAKGELGMEAAQNRDLASLTQGYGNKLYDLGRGAEEKIGASNVNYDLGALRNYKATLGGAGGFTLGDTVSPYTKGGYGTGSLEYDREAQIQNRKQALVKTAGEAVVAGRNYNDLFA